MELGKARLGWAGLDDLLRRRAGLMNDTQERGLMEWIVEETRRYF
jgi:hypothetical protein